ncbi:MAG: hypothetical protein ACFB4I_03600 [Cyanophyceae cyanobacterium]
MKLLPPPGKVKFLVPLQPHLWRIAYSKTKPIYNPCQLWRSYKIAYLERCWNWKQAYAEKLERCWHKEYQPRGALVPKSYHPQSRIELKWRGVSYYRPAVSLASVTQLTTSAASHFPKRLASDYQPSPHPSQT